MALSVRLFTGQWADPALEALAPLAKRMEYDGLGRYPVSNHLVGRGDINFEETVVALNDFGYESPLLVEWEDFRMERAHGAAESGAFTQSIDFGRSQAAFAAAFDKENQ